MLGKICNKSTKKIITTPQITLHNNSLRQSVNKILLLRTIFSTRNTQYMIMPPRFYFLKEFTIKENCTLLKHKMVLSVEKLIAQINAQKNFTQNTLNFINYGKYVCVFLFAFQK